MPQQSENTPSQPDPLKALEEVISSPRITYGANTRTTYEFSQLLEFRGPSATTVTDIHELAENIMFDTTRLVSELDKIRPAQAVDAAPSSRNELVTIVSVLQGASAVTLAFSILCGVGSLMSGTVLLHPLLALVLIVSSAGFLAMSFFK
jgi:hypothetical protein